MRPKARVIRPVSGVCIVLLAALALVLPNGAASASSPPTIFVGNQLACSATGGGAATQPFCTLQQAADVVGAGQTVEVIGGGTYAPFTLAHSGAPMQPITFTSVGPIAVVSSPSGATALDSVNDVVISRMNFSFIGGGGVVIRNSHDITLNQVIVEDDSTSNSPDGVDVSDGSYNIVVSRSAIGRGAILVNSNAHDITVTTNFFYNGIGAGVEAYNGAQNVDITSNLISGGCGTAIVVASASAVIENNVISEPAKAACPAAAGAITVDADSVANVTSDYNAIFAESPWTEYLWGGVAFTTAASLATATGEATHDIDLAKGDGIQATQNPRLVDSANGNAPGELATDRADKQRVDDPFVANTGTGESAPDRGMTELQDAIGVTSSMTPTTSIAPFTSDLTVSGLTSSWSEPLTVTADFGDGSTPVTVTDGKASHAYSIPGVYTETTTVADSGGATVTRSARIVAGTATRPAASLAVGPFTYDFRRASPT